MLLHHLVVDPQPGAPPSTRKRQGGVSRVVAREKNLTSPQGLEYSLPVRRKFVPILLLLAILSILSLSRHRGLTALPTADSILIIKHDHSLTLFRDGHRIKQYSVALGRGGLGPKQQAGDNKVPEGTYRIVGRNPHSAFYRALRVGYPTPSQLAAARARGVDPGGDIMIHGIRNGLGWLGPAQRLVDWTKGCIAVTDPEMDQIWAAVPDGTPIEIRP